MAQRKLCLFTTETLQAALNALFIYVKAMFAKLPSANGHAGLAVEVDE